MKLTPWFPGNRKPARPGVYIRDVAGNPAFSLWNGVYWLASASSPPIAASIQLPSVLQRTRWRGLAEKPKAVKA